MKPEQKRTQLIDDVTTRLSPWIYENESEHLKKGASYVPTDKLSQMSQFLQNKETTCDQKALLAKALLTKGYLDFQKHKINTGLAVLSIPFLMTLGYLTLGIHGVIKKNAKEQLSAILISGASYFLADRTQKNFLEETKDSRYFFRVLSRDKQEQQRIIHEHQKWFTQSSQR